MYSPVINTPILYTTCTYSKSDMRAYSVPNIAYSVLNIAYSKISHISVTHALWKYFTVNLKQGNYSAPPLPPPTPNTRPPPSHFLTPLPSPITPDFSTKNENSTFGQFCQVEIYKMTKQTNSYSIKNKLFSAFQSHITYNKFLVIFSVLFNTQSKPFLISFHYQK